MPAETAVEHSVALARSAGRFILNPVANLSAQDYANSSTILHWGGSYVPVYQPAGGVMKKRTAVLLRREAATALLDRDHLTGHALRDEMIIADAKRKFGALGYDDLDTVRERWRLVEILERILAEYGCSAAAEDQVIAREVTDFLAKYNLHAE